MSDFLGMAAQGWPINLTAQKATILSGASSSDVIPCQGKAPVALIIPGTWTAASIQVYANFQGSAPNSSSWMVVKDSTTGNLLQTIPATGDWIVFPFGDAIFAPFIKLVSVTAGTVNAVNQNQDVDIYLLFRNFVD